VIGIQTRDESGSCISHSTIAAAFLAASEDPEIWKVSWDVPETGERVRFTRRETSQGTFWFFDPMVLPDFGETRPSNIQGTLDYKED